MTSMSKSRARTFAIPMEQRAVVRFFTLKRTKAKDIKTELDEVYGKEALSLSAVKKWRKRFADGRPSLDDDPRPGRPCRSDLANPIQSLLRERPFISCKVICKKLRIPKTTCLRVLHDELGLLKRHLRWVPHRLEDSQKALRVAFSHDILEVLRRTQENDFAMLLTGDEAWFYSQYQHDSMWADASEELPTRVRPKISSRKCLICVIWSPMGIHSLLAVPSGSQYNSHFFCDNVLADLKANLTEGSRRKTLQGYFLHLDNAPAHNARISQQAINDLRATRVPQPPYSPDIAPSDFFLFGHIKNEILGMDVTSETQLLETITRSIEKIPKAVLIAVYNEWQKRLQWVIDSAGEYYPE